MATDTGIVKIYDMENDGKPLTCHRIDAREFLAHPSGRWSASPDRKNENIKDVKTLETPSDSPTKMKYGEMTVRQLHPIARDKNIKGWSNMNKADLVEALTALEDAPPEPLETEETEDVE
jgi:hypothetical protein